MENSTQELKVESVSAINKTQITVSFKALTEAKENYTFEVKDNNGKDVAVKEIAVLDVGETEATITFVTPLAANPAGKWTVNGVEFDADAQAAVEAVKTAGNQVALLNALKSSYFQDVNADLIAKYEAKGFTNAETVADVQKIIDEVNKENISADAVEKVNEAKNQVELLKALQDGGFARVNADLIKEYAEYDTGAGADYKTATDADAVQAIIDAVNLKAAQDATLAADTTAATALSSKAIADAQALVNALPEKEDAEKADKKALQDRLDKANAVAKVKAATTQASLLSALKTPVLDLKNIDDKLAKFYKAEFDTKKASITSVSAVNLQTAIVDAGKTAAITDTAKKISEVTDKTSTADLKALLTELKRLDGTTFTEDIIDALLEDYRDALVAETTVTNKDETGEINAIIQATNDPTTALTTLVDAGNALDDADKLLKALKAKTLNLKNINDANKDAYFADNAAIKTAAGTSAAAVQAVVNATDARVALNAATTDTAAQSALTKFAIATGNTTYINLSSTAKLEVAGLVLAEKPVTGYADNADVTSEITTQDTARGTLLTNVNGAATINAMNTALSALDYKAYNDLSASQKVSVAEAFLANFPTDKEGVKVAYTTLAGVKADIDKAITAVAE